MSALISCDVWHLCSINNSWLISWFCHQMKTCFNARVRSWGLETHPVATKIWLFSWTADATSRSGNVMLIHSEPSTTWQWCVIDNNCFVRSHEEKFSCTSEPARSEYCHIQQQQFVCPSVRPSVRLSVHPSVCFTVWPLNTLS